MAANIVFIRHGFSAQNAVYEYSLQPPHPQSALAIDPPLTEVGVAQARERSLERRQTQRRPDIVLCSTLLRAIETALVLFGTTNEVIVAPHLEEIGTVPGLLDVMIHGNGVMRPWRLQHQKAWLANRFPLQSMRLNTNFVTDQAGRYSLRYRSSYDLFLKWLSSALPHLLRASKVTHRDERPLEIAVVTHGNYMRTFVHAPLGLPQNLAEYKETGWVLPVPRNPPELEAAFAKIKIEVRPGVEPPTHAEFERASNHAAGRRTLRHYPYHHAVGYL